MKKRELIIGDKNRSSAANLGAPTVSQTRNDDDVALGNSHKDENSGYHLSTPHPHSQFLFFLFLLGPVQQSSMQEVRQRTEDNLELHKIWTARELLASRAMPGLEVQKFICIDPPVPREVASWLSLNEKKRGERRK